MRFEKAIALVFGLCLTAYAADDPFAGKWNLNVAKSKFKPGPPLKSETVTVGQDRSVKVEGMDAGGQAFSWTYAMAEDGNKAPITGMGEGSSVIGKQTGNTIVHTWNLAGKPSTGKGTISKDGKTMTYRNKGTGQDGKPMDNVMIFERHP